MQLQLDANSYIIGYATLGTIVGGMEAPDDALAGCDEASLQRACYRWQAGMATLDEAKLAAILNTELTDTIRAERAAQCWSVVNRGPGWYIRLTEQQRVELNEWYQAWLDAPETKIMPPPLSWLT